MNKKKSDNFNMVMVVSMFAFIVTFILSTMNSKFIPSCMLMLSLFLFSICYIIKDDNKKILLYILYTIGVLLIVGSLIYTNMRIN